MAGRPLLVRMCSDSAKRLKANEVAAATMQHLRDMYQCVTLGSFALGLGHSDDVRPRAGVSERLLPGAMVVAAENRLFSCSNRPLPVSGTDPIEPNITVYNIISSITLVIL